MKIDLITADINTRIEPHPTRGGISIYFADKTASISPVWNLGGFQIQFAGLSQGTSLELRAGSPCYLKVITGEIDRHPFKPFPTPGEVATTQINEAQVSALQDSVLCLLRETEKATPKITSMTQLKVHGPFEELLNWQSFDEKFAAVTDVFHGLEAHMVPGFHLLDGDGTEIAYVHFWTTGKGVDVSTHDHGQAPSELNPAFAEVHLVLRNGTGGGGMYRCDTPVSTERDRMPMQAGQEHGPFFRIDSATGSPKRRSNGAVDYPWHGWQGGIDDEPVESYDLVAAFEINPQYVRFD